jgi:hypothetical protein
MKRPLLLCFVCLSLIACKKEKTSEELPLSYEVGQNPNWNTEPFKYKYSIQFPAGYTGGMFSFEGNTFDKRFPGDTIMVFYAFSNWPGIGFKDFNDTLFNPLEPSVILNLWGGGPILLNHRIEFTKQGELVGILYYNTDSLCYGKLFWKENGLFREALHLVFRPNLLIEMASIIRTIKKTV